MGWGRENRWGGWTLWFLFPLLLAHIPYLAANATVPFPLQNIMQSCRIFSFSHLQLKYYALYSQFLPLPCEICTQPIFLPCQKQQVGVTQFCPWCKNNRWKFQLLLQASEAAPLCLAMALKSLSILVCHFIKYLLLKFLPLFSWQWSYKLNYPFNSSSVDCFSFPAKDKLNIAHSLKWASVT